MKVKVKSWNAVAYWLWDVKDPDDICGICQSNFDGCCASCKEPGDSCPLRKSCQQNQANMRRLQASSKLLLIRSLLIFIPASPSTVFGKCSHEFHLHCIMKWLQDNDGCPSCRRPWAFTLGFLSPHLAFYMFHRQSVSAIAEQVEGTTIRTAANTGAATAAT
ncbi:uncharacterized protein UHO2_00227 [Ustilago hordei]|uniref:uncharacterized protein n=1 Tax=Ustilago hordei TaxID=120017 RepID=UPI001A5FAF3A|nr:uncharacterized protein UHO2_00227 [Ustilago hordei]SYW81723.1 related to anaphase promoting complex subunit 11 [Ustilago hordei]